MYKKLFSVMAALFLLLSIIPKVEAASSFKDVTTYKDEIEFLTSKGIIKGYDGGYFKPNDAIKRLQAVQMILREKGITNFDAPNPGFIDVKSGDYGYGEIAKAVQLGIISGKTNSKGQKYFDPFAPLTRGQMAKIFTLAYNLKGSYPADFKDINKSSETYGYVSSLAANGITTGYSDGTFKPNVQLSRQHFSAFMARYLDDKFKPAKEMFTHFIDVGQGDSILVQTPNGKTILIDGGKRSAGDKVVAYLKKAGVNSIDVLVATHPDADHIGGLISVLESIPVKKVLDSGKTHTTDTYYQYLSLIDSKNISFEVPTTGQTLAIDTSVKVQVLNSGDQNASDNNDNSIVLKLTYGGVSFLLTGDAGIDIENKMISKFDLKSTILKAGHHGAKTSTSQAFVNAVKPEVTILSYGKDNSYGHPVSEVVSRLKAAGSKLYSTADSSDIVVKTDGKGYTVFSTPWKGTEPVPTPIPTPKANVSITNVDEAKEIVTIKNNGTSDVNMTGWKLVSVEGNQTYTFPSEFVLKAGKTVTVTSGPNAVDNPPTYLKWTTANIWLNSGDPAELYNAEGGKVSEMR
ncbi:S-layer homology domain-containing protein [Peribacillus loiseleuriae]|uniref:S-layer homology domain-containing protein n=1 Tax=Peribacillus loiseleuriae TaxID=1679170 RepID=UPI003D00D605